MNNNHFHPPSSIINPKIRDFVNLETITVRELSEVAQQYGLRLENVFSF